MDGQAALGEMIVRGRKLSGLSALASPVSAAPMRKASPERRKRECEGVRTLAMEKSRNRSWLVATVKKEVVASNQKTKLRAFRQ